MTADDVLSVLAVLREADADIWIGGGWVIDALPGRQTRQRRDLDLMHRKSQERPSWRLSQMKASRPPTGGPCGSPSPIPVAGKSIFTR